jgi:polysaccharide biosynthesis protein PslH
VLHRVLSFAAAKIVGMGIKVHMRVLWLSHVVPFPPKAGVLLRAYYLLKSVAEHHEVDLIAFVQRPLLATFYSDIEAGLEECRLELLKHCRSVTFLQIAKSVRPFGKIRTACEALFTRDGYIASWLASSAARELIVRCVQGRHYDVAHFDSISVASYRPLVQDTPATLGHHNAESHMLVRRSQLEASLLKKLYFRLEAARLARFESRIASWFRLHITCSDLDSQRLHATMPSARITSVPNGVDTEFFKPSRCAEIPNSLIFVGTLSWYPNRDAVMYLLREIWPRLRAAIPSATLDIVGAGASAALRDLAAHSAGVTLHGFVLDIRPLIERAALYICPIRDGGGTKLKILDALAMEKCIVAHAVACEGIAVTPGIDVTFAEAPNEFVEQIKELFNDPERRRTMGAAARRLALHQYSFVAIGAAFTEALRVVAEAEIS